MRENPGPVVLVQVRSSCRLESICLPPDRGKTDLRYATWLCVDEVDGGVE